MLLIAVLLEYLASTAPVYWVEKTIHTANTADADLLEGDVGAVGSHVLALVNRP